MPSHIFNDRIVFFNNLTEEAQRRFIDYVYEKGLDIDGDVVYLPETERLTTLKNLFPNEEEFKSGEKVIVRGALRQI